VRAAQSPNRPVLDIGPSDRSAALAQYVNCVGNIARNYVDLTIETGQRPVVGSNNKRPR
jgi:hypothetical protein